MITKTLKDLNGKTFRLTATQATHDYTPAELKELKAVVVDNRLVTIEKFSTKGEPRKLKPMSGGGLNNRYSIVCKAGLKQHTRIDEILDYTLNYKAKDVTTPKDVKTQIQPLTPAQKILSKSLREDASFNAIGGVYGIYHAYNKETKQYSIVSDDTSLVYRCYIGSTGSFKRRFKQHKDQLAKDEHHNKELQLGYDRSNNTLSAFMIPLPKLTRSDDDMQLYTLALLVVEQCLMNIYHSIGMGWKICNTTKKPALARPPAELKQIWLKYKERLKKLGTVLDDSNTDYVMINDYIGVTFDGDSNATAH